MIDLTVSDSEDENQVTAVDLTVSKSDGLPKHGLVQLEEASKNGAPTHVPLKHEGIDGAATCPLDESPEKKSSKKHLMYVCQNAHATVSTCSSSHSSVMETAMDDGDRSNKRMKLEHTVSLFLIPNTQHS